MGTDWKLYGILKTYVDTQLSGTGIKVGYVEPGGSLPATRPDGTALQDEDYVQPRPDSDFPFTIGNITFTNSKDKAFYLSGNWFLSAGVLQDTKETPLAEPAEESYDEDELFANQHQVNATVMEQLRNNLIESEDLDTIDTDKIVKRIYHQTEDTEARDKGLYWYNANSTEEDKWEKVGSADVMPYEYITPVGDIDNSYMAEVNYTDLDYAFADEYYQNNITNFGACSTIVKDGKLIRNYDWHYSNSCGFLVRTPAINNRHAVVGIVGQVDGLTKDFVKSGKYSEMYKLVPFALTDGQNDMGLKASILVVPNDKGNTTGTLANGKRVNALMFIRYMLDHYASVDEVKQATQNELSIFVPQVMRDMGYEVHFVLYDSTMADDEAWILEFVNNACVWTKHNKATNFFIAGTIFKSDGTVAVIGDSDIDDYGLTEHSEGLERYNILVNSDTLSSEELVEKLKYSKLYTLDSNKWYSELCSGDLQITSPMADFESAMTAAREQYATRSRDTALTDHTVHSVIYGKDSVKLFTQENYSIPYIFNIERDIISSDRVELVDGSIESFSGDAETQAEVNKELVDELKFLESKTDVVDIVQCYDRGTDETKTDIVHYDLDTVLLKDIVKVLIDETHDDKVSYYRVIESGAPATKYFNYIGSDKPVEVEDLTLNKDANGKIQMKDKGHDFTKVKDTAIGDGLEKSADGTKIQHSNSIVDETTGKGSTSKSLTAKWDAQGHITEVEENDIDFDSVELSSTSGTLTTEQKEILEKSNGSYVIYNGNVLRKDNTTTGTPNSDLLGQWQFRSVVNIPDRFEDMSIIFMSDGLEYHSMLADGGIVLYDSVIEVYNNYTGGWVSPEYSIIDIIQEPTDEAFITWFRENAIRQSYVTVTSYSNDKYLFSYYNDGNYTITEKPQGGGEPENYLKTINKDPVLQKVTITDQDGVETEFSYGGGGGGTGGIVYDRTVKRVTLPSSDWDDNYEQTVEIEIPSGADIDIVMSEDATQEQLFEASNCIVRAISNTENSITFKSINGIKPSINLPIFVIILDYTAPNNSYSADQEEMQRSVFPIQLLSSGWDANREQVVEISGLSEDGDIEIIQPQNASLIQLQVANACIVRATEYTNTSIVFKCLGNMTPNINLDFIVVSYFSNVVEED